LSALGRTELDISDISSSVGTRAQSLNDNIIRKREIINQTTVHGIMQNESRRYWISHVSNTVTVEHNVIISPVTRRRKIRVNTFFPSFCVYSRRDSYDEILKKYVYVYFNTQYKLERVFLVSVWFKFSSSSPYFSIYLSSAILVLNFHLTRSSTLFTHTHQQSSYNVPSRSTTFSLAFLFFLQRSISTFPAFSAYSLNGFV